MIFQRDNHYADLLKGGDFFKYDEIGFFIETNFR